jgi:nitroreductase
MDALECIFTRRSIRRYLDVPIEFDKIATIIEAGARAPNAGDIQNWRFIVVTNEQLIKSLYNVCLQQPCVYNAKIVIVICSLPEEGEKFYGVRGKRLYSIQNCAASAENMLLAAHALGLGANWVGAFDEDKVCEIFDIPADARPQVIITLGYSDELPQPKIVKELAFITFFNRYGNKTEHAHTVLRDWSQEWSRQGKIIDYDVHRRAKHAGKKLKEYFVKVKDKTKEKK